MVILVIICVMVQLFNFLKVVVVLQVFFFVVMVELDLDMFLDEYVFFVLVDSLFLYQWYFNNDGFVIDVNFCLKKGVDFCVVSVWNCLGNMGKVNIMVVVIDNGFDINYFDLCGKIFKFWDFWIGFFNLLQGDICFIYGIFCVSVVIVVSNGQGIVGVVFGVCFMLINGILFSVKIIEEMFDYCICNGVDVISCSWGIMDVCYSFNIIKE